MQPDKTSFNNQQKPQSKPGARIDAGAPDKDTESRLDKLTDKDAGGGLRETQPGPGGEAPGQVSKM